jgi:cyclohexadienyl dehydratase
VASASTAGPLRVGTSGDYPPFSRERSAGKFGGFDLELANRLGRELGMQVELVRFRWPDLVADLRNGAFDIVMSGVTMRPERAIAGRFTRPYAKTSAVALIRKADAVRFASPAALNAPGRRIVVNAGGHLESVARRFFPRASIRTVSDNLSLPTLVRSGRADAASDYKAFLLPAASAELALRVDEWLVRHERDGWLGQKRKEWLATYDLADPQGAARHAVVAAIALRLGLMPFVAAAKRAGGNPVEDTNQEARVLARVRQQSRSAPERAEHLYRLLIPIAKEVQRSAPPLDVTIPLPSLRDAIARVDEQLVREIDRLPASRDSDWIPLLAARLSELSVETALQAELAAVLSSDR